ncbi:sugar-binding transcriptional regulator [Chakrabartyella piscis]|uniref:sugar-binding transcriptional regulator n=1 Tax=Chakrabartyella piscis TaxID=2918914 RepID=UPI0029586ABA|nr:sugar-binding domain-containing protein [Chakrabartyella piscis]
MKDRGVMMLIEEKKRARLTDVAKMYYEKNMGQKEIAEQIGVSRPMVSKLLQEARDLGIVTITIHETKSANQILAERLMEEFHLQDVILLETIGSDAVAISEKYATAICGMLEKGETYKIGVGCGSTLGMIADALEKKEAMQFQGEMYPLIGGFKATYRSYHTNELVRSMAERLGMKSTYLYLPALLGSKEEKDLYTATELFETVRELWHEMDVAWVNISGLYSAPDFATSIRFGKKLVQKNAVGRFLAHYYDIHGNFIMPEEDNMVQAELFDLQCAKNMVAICSDMVDVKAVVGSLRTRCFTKIILPERTAREVLNSLES